MVFVFHLIFCVFIKVQNLFIQFGLSFVWSLSWWWDYTVDVFTVRFPDFALCMSFKLFKFGFISNISRFFLPFIPSIPISYKTLDVWCYPWTTILFPCNLFGYIYVNAFFQSTLHLRLISDLSFWYHVVYLDHLSYFPNLLSCIMEYFLVFGWISLGWYLLQ